MKKALKKALCCLFLCLLISAPTFSIDFDFDIGDLQKTMDTFAKELALSLPFNSSIGLNWADAHIGKFPHFGVGFSAGFTTMELSSFKKLIGYFSPALPAWVLGFGGFPVPAYALEARLGIIDLLDTGFKFGYMPMKSGQFRKLDYLLVGGDVRLRLLEDKGLLPGISFGVGFNYFKGGVGMTAGTDKALGYQYPDLTDPTNPVMTPATLTLKAPELDLDWSTSSLDLKVQISKKVLVVTPYLGFGASSGWSKAGYKVLTRIEDTGGNIEMLRGIMKTFGIEDFTTNGFGASAEVTGWSFRLYGGLSFNMPFVRIELTGLYNFIDKKYGLTMGARFQI